MIESVLALESDEVELVVTDNSDGDELADWVGGRPTDSRLRYMRVRGLLSMAGNCNQAIGAATGEYLTLIGDDDTVLPNILEACRWAKENDIDALTPQTSVRYMWPDIRHRYWGMRQAGRAYLDPWRGRLKRSDPRLEALMCVRRAGQGMGSMANLYHGLVRRSLLQALKNSTGAYCFSVSPDVYLSLCISTRARTQVQFNGPVTIPGSSGLSNSGRAAVRQHKGRLWDDPHMKAYRGEAWPDEIPAFFAVETVWAQAALTACRKCEQAELERNFNFERLYALCLLHHRDFRREILQAMKARYGERVPLGRWAGVLWALAVESGRFGFARLHRALRPTPRGYSMEFGPFPDVWKAREALCKRFPVAMQRFPSDFPGEGGRESAEVGHERVGT